MRQTYYLAPVGEESLDFTRCRHILGTFNFPLFTGDTSGLETRLLKHKQNLIRLANNLTFNDQTISSFHFNFDEETYAHTGDTGWGFYLRRGIGSFALALGYLHTEEGREKLEGKSLSRYQELKQFQTATDKDAYVLELLAGDHVDGLGWKFPSGLDIALGIWGLAMTVLGLSNPHPHSIDDAYVRIRLEGSRKEVEKYLAEFREKLGTAFIEHKE